MHCECTDRDSLFLVKLEVSTIISSDGGYEGVCFYLHAMVF